MFNASNTVRLFLFNVALISLAGIALTGFQVVHWFAYVLPAFLLFATATGFCPGMVMSASILRILGVKE